MGLLRRGPLRGRRGSRRLLLECGECGYIRCLSGEEFLSASTLLHCSQKAPREQGDFHREHYLCPPGPGSFWWRNL